MAITKPTARFLPTPPPKNVTLELQEWLREEFDTISASIGQNLEETESIIRLQQFGLLDGATANVVIPDTPDFVALVSYPDYIVGEGFIVEPIAGSIEIPPIPGWLEITTFVSMKQVSNDKDFSVVAHLEVDGAALPFSSGSGYIPTQMRDLSVVIGSVKTRPTLGAEVFRLLLQVEDEISSEFSVLDTTFKIKYIQFGL